MTIDLEISILIFIILFIRHIGNNVDQILTILNSQTKSINILKNRTSYHSKINEFLIESIKPALQYVYNYGSEADRKEIVEILEKWKHADTKV